MYLDVPMTPWRWPHVYGFVMFVKTSYLKKSEEPLPNDMQQPNHIHMQLPHANPASWPSCAHLRGLEWPRGKGLRATWGWDPHSKTCFELLGPVQCSWKLDSSTHFMSDVQGGTVVFYTGKGKKQSQVQPARQAAWLLLSFFPFRPHSVRTSLFSQLARIQAKLHSTCIVIQLPRRRFFKDYKMFFRDTTGSLILFTSWREPVFCNIYNVVCYPSFRY